jgi:hypothetical protein
MAEKPRRLRDYPPELWARMSPRFRAAHNQLRRARGQLPIPDPKVDLYAPPASSPPPFDPANPEAIATEFEFRGLGDQVQDWVEIAKQLALELARKQMADRQLHKEERYRAIARFVAVAMKESGLPRKAIFDDAMGIYGVKERTIETAIKKFPSEFYFTDGTKLGPAVTVFRGLPVELRLLALGL